MTIAHRATVRHESGIEVEHALVLAANKEQPCRCRVRDATSPEQVAGIACARERFSCGNHFCAHRQRKQDISAGGAEGVREMDFA